MRLAIASTNAFPKSRKDEHAPPTLKDVSSMAQYLGIDVEREAKLAWVAWQCCIAPLPFGWSARKRAHTSEDASSVAAESNDADADDDIEYVEVGTGMVSAAHPLDSVFRMLAARERKLMYASDDTSNVDGAGGGASAASSAETTRTVSLLSSLNQGPLLLARDEPDSSSGDTYFYDFVLGREVSEVDDDTDEHPLLTPSNRGGVEAQSPASQSQDRTIAHPATDETKKKSSEKTPNSALQSRLPLSSRRKGTSGHLTASSSRHQHGSSASLASTPMMMPFIASLASLSSLFDMFISSFSAALAVITQSIWARKPPPPSSMTR